MRNKPSHDHQSLAVMLAWLAVVAVITAFGLWLGVTVWEECREAGHSALYCVRMVIR